LIIDGLKAIHIDVQQAERPPVALGAGELAFEPLEEMSPIRLPGQRVGVRQFDQLIGLVVKSVAPASYARSALPYRSAQFDGVICVDVLEHLEDDRAGLADIYRVLKPGGRLLATVPAFQSLWSRRDVQLHHKRRYTLAELRERVAAAGFRTLKISYINLTVFFPLWLMVKTGRLSAKEDAKVSVDFALLPGPVNRVLAGVAALESKVTSRVDLPVGSSIVCVAARPEEGGS